MTEAAIMILCLSAIACWFIGGTWWRPAKVFLWPILCGVLLTLSAIPFLTSIWVAVGLGVTTSLAYGDSVRWPTRWLALASYGLPALFLSAEFWWLNLLLCGGLLPGLFWLSRKFNPVSWKTVEAFFGLTQSMMIVVSVMAR